MRIYTSYFAGLLARFALPLNAVAIVLTVLLAACATTAVESEAGGTNAAGTITPDAVVFLDTANSNVSPDDVR